MLFRQKLEWEEKMTDIFLAAKVEHHSIAKQGEIWTIGGTAKVEMFSLVIQNQKQEVLPEELFLI